MSLFPRLSRLSLTQSLYWVGLGLGLQSLPKHLFCHRVNSRLLLNLKSLQNYSQYPLFLTLLNLLFFSKPVSFNTCVSRENGVVNKVTEFTTCSQVLLRVLNPGVLHIVRKRSSLIWKFHRRKRRDYVEECQMENFLSTNILVLVTLSRRFDSKNMTQTLFRIVYHSRVLYENQITKRGI